MKSEKLEMDKVAREAINVLINHGYSYKEIYNALEYMAERDRLLTVVRVNGWDYTCEYETLPIQFIEEHADQVNWKLVSIYQKLDSDTIDNFADEVDWFFVFMNQDLNDELLLKYKDRIRKAIYSKLYNAGK